MDSNGNTVIAVEIERVQFKSDQTGLPADWERLSFDSQNPIEPQNKLEIRTFGALDAFVGSQMTITINEEQEVSKFELSKPLAAHLEKNKLTQELAWFFGHVYIGWHAASGNQLAYRFPAEPRIERQDVEAGTGQSL